MLYKTTPACSPEVEAMITQTIGCAICVHRALGRGYTEAVYQDALAIEFALAGLSFDREFRFTVFYRGQPIRRHQLDFVVGGAVVVELKAVERLQRIHQTQILSYMKSGRLKAGLLMNFHADYT